MSAVKALAERLLPQYGFADWTVQIEPHRGGVPQWVGRTYVGPRILAFSAWLEDKPEWVQREIVLHEMAHALLGHGYHDAAWRAAARRFGCVLEEQWIRE